MTLHEIIEDPTTGEQVAVEAASEDELEARVQAALRELTGCDENLED